MNCAKNKIIFEELDIKSQMETDFNENIENLNAIYERLEKAIDKLENVADKMENINQSV